MESNNVEINVQGNEQRDAPVNRDAKNLNNGDVWVDRRCLVFVPAGVGGDAKERWYTAGGLLEVGGYLASGGHSIGEWAAQGGIVTFSGGEVVTQSGSNINLSGGTLDVQYGYIHLSWMRGADGRLTSFECAGRPALHGLVQGLRGHACTLGRYRHALFLQPADRAAPALRERLYGRPRCGPVGRRDGVGGARRRPHGDAYQGTAQVQTSENGLEGYYQSQTAAARRAQLIIGHYSPVYNKDIGHVA